MIVKLQNVRQSFSSLFEARPFKAGDEPKFKATFLIPKNDPQIQIIEKAIMETATLKLGAKATGIIASIRGNPNKFCFQDGDTRTYDGYEGMMALSASSKRRPQIFDRDKAPLTVADGKPYDGCYVNCSLEFFCYNNSGTGISASLRGVQFLKDGDAFTGGTPLDDGEFDDLSVSGSVI